MTNIKDGVMWGLVPVYLAGRNLSCQQIGVVAAAYPVVWGFCQLITGPLSDRWGRNSMIVVGIFIFSNVFGQWVGAAVIVGIGTALVYPTILAMVSDVAEDHWRASSLGVYRLWRDSGYALAGLSIGYLADFAGSDVTFYLLQRSCLSRQPCPRS